jgi:hypothetical protein
MWYLNGVTHMDRKDRKVVRKADKKEISKLMKTETTPKHGADERSSLGGKLAKIPPESRKPPCRK